MSSLDLISINKAINGHRVINDVNISIKDGEFIVFVGPSGCGKSTLLRLIAGLDDVTTGQIRMEGVDITTAPPSGRGVAMVFQNYALYPHMSVADNIGFGLRMAGIGRRMRREKVEEIARVLKLDTYLDRKPSELSGGQRQRVAIGRALVKNPRLFLFDEALSNLDTDLRTHMRGEIMRLHRTLGTTMIYVTHDQTEAMTMADRIVVLRAGHVEQIGTPHELYTNPRNIFVAGFMGSPRINLLDARAVDHDETGLKLSIPALCPKDIVISGPIEGAVNKNEALTVGWRVTDKDGIDTALRVQGSVDHVEWTGGSAYIRICLEDGQDFAVESRQLPLPAIGDRMALSLDPNRFMVFRKDGTRLL